MKKLFRFFALALSACLTVGLFAGCDLFGAGTDDGGSGSIEGVWIFRENAYSDTAVEFEIAEVEGQPYDAVLIRAEIQYVPAELHPNVKLPTVTAAKAAFARAEDGAYYADFGEGEAKIVSRDKKLTYTLGDVTTEYVYDSELPERTIPKGETFSTNRWDYLGRVRYSEDGTQAEFYTDYRGERTTYSALHVGSYDIFMDDADNIVYTIGRRGIWEHNFDLEEGATATLVTFTKCYIYFHLGDHGVKVPFQSLMVDCLDNGYAFNYDSLRMEICYGDTVRLPNAEAAAGYTFTGWRLRYMGYDGSFNEYYDNVDMEFQYRKLNPHFYANYEAIVYDLTYSDGADAEGEVTGMPEAGGTISLESGELTLPAAPSRDGYNFAGWTLNGKPLGSAYTLTAEDIPKEGKEIVITAAWTAE